MRTAAQQAGDAAELLVAERLAAAGWTILGRNVRVGRAELDLVGVDPGGPALVVVEVRWRSRRDYGLAEETIDRAKVARLRAAAIGLVGRKAFGDGTAVPRLPLRLDLVVVEPGGITRHHRNLGAG
ncbi:MAG TPA: YraN family protein [Candidatus Limnocylindrales bacterium]|nr:YraN family protein [Candidatus Limnocylindrales bacterium]